MNNNNNDNKNTLKNKIISTIFLAWFFASIGMMFYFSETNGLYCVVIFGQYFLVFGLLAFFSSLKEKGGAKFFPLIFVVVGLACIIIPLLQAHPELISVRLNWDAIIPALLLLVFVLVGVGMLVIPPISRKKKLKSCTYSIRTTIKEHKKTRGNSSTLYCPVYEFYYNGKTYEVDENSYSNVGVKPVGTEVELLINPSDPEEFVIKEKTHDLISLIIGIMFLLLSVPILIYFLMTNPLII